MATIWFSTPAFPACDLPPGWRRYQVGEFWVDWPGEAASERAAEYLVTQLNRQRIERESSVAAIRPVGIDARLDELERIAKEGLAAVALIDRNIDELHALLIAISEKGRYYGA